MDTPSGIKDSIPAWIKFSVQAPGEIPYNGIYYDPPEEVLAWSFTLLSQFFLERYFLISVRWRDIVRCYLSVYK